MPASASKDGMAAEVVGEDYISKGVIIVFLTKLRKQ